MGKGTSTLWVFTVTAIRATPTDTTIMECAGICAFDTKEEAAVHAEGVIRDRLKEEKGGDKYEIKRAAVKPVDMPLLRQQLEACGWSMLRKI